jgi:acylphosphatase
MVTGDARHSVHVLIEGRVQGVGFRYFTQCAAIELGLAGFVRNRRDGAVEALFCGPPTAVAEMLRRCRAGPRGARVAAVHVTTEGESGADGDEPSGFTVLESL